MPKARALPALTTDKLTASLYYPESEENEDDVSLEALIADGDIAFSESRPLACRWPLWLGGGR